MHPWILSTLGYVIFIWHIWASIFYWCLWFIFDICLGVYLHYASLSHQTRLWEWSTYSGVLASRQTAAPPSDSDRAVTPGPRDSTRQLSPARGAEIRHRPGRVSSWLPVESYSSPVGPTRWGIQYRSHTLRGDPPVWGVPWGAGIHWVDTRDSLVQRLAVVSRYPGMSDTASQCIDFTVSVSVQFTEFEFLKIYSSVIQYSI